jgi:hypothetical protein
MLSFFNQNLSNPDIVVKILNMVGCCYAIYWNIQASNTGMLVKTRLTVAALAFVYLIAYFVLLLTNIDVATWSNFLTYIGVGVWPIVWAGQAKAGIGVQENLSNVLEKTVLHRLGIHDEKDGDER